MNIGAFSIITLLFASYIPLNRAEAQINNGALERTDAFETAFGMTYQLDFCGESMIGDQYRAAILEKFDNCPFTVSARERFRQRADETSAKSLQMIQKYFAEHGKNPEQLDGMKVSCEEQRRSKNYVNLRDLLQKYHRGEIGANAIITDDCGVGPGAP